MLINDDELRKQLREFLKTRTRNSIVKEIKEKHGKFHQYQIDNFLNKKDVTLSTAIKLDEYCYKHLH